MTQRTINFVPDNRILEKAWSVSSESYYTPFIKWTAFFNFPGWPILPAFLPGMLDSLHLPLCLSLHPFAHWSVTLEDDFYSCILSIFVFCLRFCVAKRNSRGQRRVRWGCALAVATFLFQDHGSKASPACWNPGSSGFQAWFFVLISLPSWL